MKTVNEWLTYGIEQLYELGPEEARASTEALVSEVLLLNRSALYLQADRQLSQSQSSVLKRQIEQRKARIPLAYLLGKAYFWDECLTVGPGCLIPRPETELLVGWLTGKLFPGKSSTFSFLDLGTGSGALAVALLRHYPKACGTLTDISDQALSYARLNLERYGLTNRAQLVRTNLFCGFSSSAKWDVILTNPPYLSDQDFKDIQPELLCEPREALHAGPRGDEFYFCLAEQARNFLFKDGWIAAEMGMGQSPGIREHLKKNNFRSIETFRDYADIERIITAQK